MSHNISLNTTRVSLFKLPVPALQPSFLDYFCISHLASFFLVGKSREAAQSPSRSTGPVWIIQIWQNCAVAVINSKASTAAPLRSWAGRDLCWESCLRWDLWGIDCTVWAAWVMDSILADYGLCKRLWLHLRSGLILLQFGANHAFYTALFFVTFLWVLRNTLASTN